MSPVCYQIKPGVGVKSVHNGDIACKIQFEIIAKVQSGLFIEKNLLSSLKQ